MTFSKTFSYLLLGISFPFVSFAQKHNDSKIDNLNAVKLPKYMARFGSNEDANKEEILKSHLLVQRGITCISLNSQYHAPCEVIGYKITIISDGKILYSKILESSLFNDETKEVFQQLHKEDLIIIQDIIIRNPIGTQKIPSIIYKVK